eukprot:CAMPEP_0113609284 /NCGR_PEP_ID=MMETSP0017_2-20120614/4405_1 /TAXON_ID=2856 /ORGANISM="Cylindrotheca closterium" /LENGTH=76 /DNA_ID=CAMNT_0000518083 /DNA_START=102 /DNA_END=333 /DNA_ORIENTATION=- /assembly_acc=CAM_ASM_000147
MKKVISSILFAILIGTAAAFFRPATPYQVESPAKPEFLTFGEESLLDNPNIAEDTNISPPASAASAWDEPGKPPVQ